MEVPFSQTTLNRATLCHEPEYQNDVFSLTFVLIRKPLTELGFVCTCVGDGHVNKLTIGMKATSSP